MNKRPAPLPPPTISTHHADQEETDEGGDSFNDTADALLLQIGATLDETNAVVTTELNTALLDDARHLRYRMNFLAASITRQLKNLEVQTHICRFKYAAHHRIFSAMNITTIVLGVCISLYSTVIEIVERQSNHTIQGIAGIFVDSVTPTLGAIIALLGILISAKKLRETMETIGKIIEKSAYIQSRLPGLIDRVENCKSLQEFEQVEAEYQGETRTLLSSCDEQIGQILNLEDSVLHSERIQFFKLRQQTSEANYVVHSAEISALKDYQLSQVINRIAVEEDDDDGDVTENAERQDLALPSQTMDPSAYNWDNAMRPPASPANGTCWTRMCVRLCPNSTVK